MNKFNRSILRAGAAVSIIQSGLFLAIAISALLLGIDNFINYGFGSLYSQSPPLFILLCSSFVLIAILGVVITPAEKQIIGKYNPAASTIGGYFAYLGHFGTIAFFSWWLVLVMNKDAALLVNFGDIAMPIKWGAMFELLFVGLWVWIIAYAIFRNGALTKSFGWLSVAKAISFWLTLLAFVINNKILLLIGLTGTAVIFGPLWHAIIARFFWRYANKAFLKS